MQDAMQDAVCNKHEQMGMPTAPNVLRCEHNRQSAWGTNNDKDVKEQERECVCVVVEKDNEYTVKHKRET